MYQNPFLPPLVAVPSWPHATPLLAGLDERGDLRLATMELDEIAEALRTEKCACALVPPAVLLDNPALCVLPGAGLVAGEDSTMERLLSNRALESIRRIKVTAEARPLSIYLQIIFATRGIPVPIIIPSDEDEDGDALLVTGAGLPTAATTGYNIADLWRTTTGTPLVLGVWACQGAGPIRMLRTVLGEAARRGTSASEDHGTSGPPYTYRMLSEESECLRTLHRLARQFAIAGASVESIAFC